MCRIGCKLYCAMIVTMMGLMSLGAAPAMGQTTELSPVVEEGDVETADTANPPAYIDDLMEAMGLEKTQIDLMRADGLGWGEIRIAVLLAEKIAANSGGTLDFEAALAQVLAARESGKGFGEIAAENNLKIGELLKNGGKEKAPGLLARLGKFLGLGKPAKSREPVGMERKLQEGSAVTARGDKPERPIRAGHTIRAERPERLDRPSRPDKPERPDRPERGPHAG